MPRPPILPVPDRQAIFASGATFKEWLANPDKPEQAERINALYEEFELPDNARADVSAINRPVHVIAIAETWCGDVIKHTPVLMHLAEASCHVQVRFVTREQYPDFFARFLTNGGEAIPKFVFCNESFTEVGNWGPMPSKARQWISLGKACDDVKTARQKVGDFYEQDNHRETIRELTELIQTAAFEGF